MWTRASAVRASTVVLIFAVAASHRPAFAQDAATASGSGSCVALMAATVTGADGNAAEAGAAVRDLFVSLLAGPLLQPLPLESRLRVQAVEEARQKGCAYMVTAAVAHRRGSGSGLGSVLGRAAGGAAWHIPGGSGGAAVARGVSAGAARAIGDMAHSTRAKDEMRLEWTLSPLSKPGPSPSPRTEKLKASADGEDLLTPLVQRAAESIAERLLQKH